MNYRIKSFLPLKINQILFSLFNENEIQKIIQESKLFDESYYKKLVGSFFPYSTPLSHFVNVGYRKKLSPSPYFSTEFYLTQNDDVNTSGMNPLVHYILHGEDEGRCPNPFFNPKRYLELNPDLIGFDRTLLLHYILYGKEEKRNFTEYADIRRDINNDLYKDWILKNESESFQEIKSSLDCFVLNPLISIVLPVFNTEENILIRCIESVLAQSYTNWELCIADDKSTKYHVRKVLKHYKFKDRRIKIIYRHKNGHISAASNSALSKACGDWVALLDHDDELHQHALFYVVKAINDKPDVEFIYSDEDKIDKNGQRIEPHFKPSWNLDLLYSQNYISHLGVYKTNIVKKVGGFRLGFEGSQDYDLLLRYSREIDHNKITHIPKVLYHWRMVDGSTALDSNEKYYTTNAGIKALEDHFSKLDKAVKVERGKNNNTYKVNWEINNKPLVSLIIPAYNGYEITKRAINSILEKSTYEKFEIILVDNNSDDNKALEYFEEINKHEKVNVLRYPYQFNYSAINNFAVRQANGEIIGLINNDVEVINPEWLTEMVAHAQREDIGCVGAMLYYPNNTIQHAGIIIGIGGVAGHAHKFFKRGEHGYFGRLDLIQNFSAVTAACLLVRREVFNEVNGFNEKYLTVAFNDVDLCLKIQKSGYRNIWTPYAELYHHESISRGEDNSYEKLERFSNEIEYMKKIWHTDIKIDQFYNENLTLEKEDFSLNI
ncbi:glycosyltransferase family 2 protein [Grimontia hollisae]|uniref:Chondroitin polymerase n=1 Tax=Grimontia hollisae TaxID=673 RepID=A0A377HMU0_GRIHO|nr:glycosyltransferase family 2 protein [Grimontia hollisae]STO57333.1 Chondroitin polymerase [Grimontia hollisae]